MAEDFDKLSKCVADVLAKAEVSHDLVKRAKDAGYSESSGDLPDLRKALANSMLKDYGLPPLGEDEFQPAYFITHAVRAIADKNCLGK